jgi:hypothetical protein
MLFTPGKITDLTAGMIQRVVAAAYRDHNYQPGPCDCTVLDSQDHSRPHDDWCAMLRHPDAKVLSPAEIVINEVAEPGGDQAFDRVAYARGEGERFWYDGGRYRVVDFPGRWVCEADDGSRRPDIDQETIAWQLTLEHGPHPDPYIAVVEVTYDVDGHRAGYGVRRSGAVSCWYD